MLGLAVLAADANASLGSNRYLLTFAGLGAVALVLFLVGFIPAARRLRKAGEGGYGAAAGKAARRALVPLIPVVLAPGWSALVLEGAQLDLNPMSATLGALVIAIATEFSVLLSSRYYEERERGESVGEALRLTYSRTGAAVIASGLTAIAGFAVLALAAPVTAIFGGDAIRMLTEFGVVGVIDLVIALAGVLLVLPAVLVWAEGDFAAARASIGRVRRRRPVGGARVAMSDPPRQPGEEAPEGEKPRPGARYPLIVGIAFVALIAYATYNSIQTDEGGLLGRRGRRAGEGAAGVRGAGHRERPRGRRERLSGRLRDVPEPVPRAARPRVPDRGAGRDPRLRPLRQAARDLVLVHGRRRLPGGAGRLQPRVRALRGRGQLLDR